MFTINQIESYMASATVLMLKFLFLLIMSIVITKNKQYQ